MNYRINIEISPSSSSLDLTDIQDIQNPSEHADTDFDESEPEETFKYPLLQGIAGPVWNSGFLLSCTYIVGIPTSLDS